MKKNIVISFLLIGLIILFEPGDLPDNSQFQEGLNSVSQDEIVIVFNSGGWGNTPVDEAGDFKPIIEGVQETLNDLGYKSIVVPYKRTKDSFWGKIEGIRSFLTSFKSQSAKLAQEIEDFVENNPNTKVIVAGLSSGGAFVDKTMECVSEKNISNIFTIELGIPFWEESFDSENVLFLNNEGKDPLSKGEAGILVFSLFKTPFKWLLAKISGENISLSRALHIPGHEYFWDSSTTGGQITTFIKDKFVPQNF